MIALQIKTLSAPEAASKEVLLDAFTAVQPAQRIAPQRIRSPAPAAPTERGDRTLAAFLRVQNKRVDLLSQIMARGLLDEVATAAGDHLRRRHRLPTP